MDEFRLHAYERSDLYKEWVKKYHDRRIVQRNFQKDDMVLLFQLQTEAIPRNEEAKGYGLGISYENIGKEQGKAYVNLGHEQGKAYAMA
ncbi:hypothetical protein CQW23_25565 [Capsicum baccatum]|uniref:Uncharacterized protein n=1 Tax=Capsicum baccatum TaxID=33114 RepID=A0A2G2VLA0_CAPBA|nr:hypothetical protein CQW23_25565 [Capsicum baccatum]